MMEGSLSTGKFRRSAERNACVDDVDNPASDDSSSSSSFRSGDLAARSEPRRYSSLLGDAGGNDWVPAVTTASRRRSEYVDAVNARWSQEVVNKADALPTTDTRAAAELGTITQMGPSANARALFLENDSSLSPAAQPRQPSTSTGAADPAALSTGDLLHAPSSREREVAQHEKILNQYKKELAQEREDRRKAEQDLADVLFQSQQVSAQHSCDNQRHERVADDAEDGVRLSVGDGGSQPTTSHSDALWEAMRSRQERARQRVRKEFIEQAQDRLVKEQRRREEAESAVAEAMRRADLSETAQLAAEERRQQALQQLDVAKAELHERYVLIEELRAQIARLERHADQQAQQHQREVDRGAARLRAAEALAEQRDAALEAQRQFAERLRQELGIKDMDLLSKDSLYEDVLARVAALHDEAAHEQERLDRQRQDMEDTYQLRFSEQQVELDALRRRCAMLQHRCDGAPAVSKAELSRLEAAVACATEERDRAQGELLALRVENESLRLQLEKFTAYAKRLSTDKAEATERYRAEREALLRRYESENTALTAQLATLRDTLKTENEKHIQQILELSEQLTCFRGENTRLVHQLNAVSHDRGEATRRLSVAQEAVQKLHTERAQLSNSLAYLRDRSYAEEDDAQAMQSQRQYSFRPSAAAHGLLTDRHGSSLPTPTHQRTPHSDNHALNFAPGPETRASATRPSRSSPSPRRTARALSILTEGQIPSTSTAAVPMSFRDTRESPSPSAASAAARVGARGGDDSLWLSGVPRPSQRRPRGDSAASAGSGVVRTGRDSPMRQSHAPVLQHSALTALTTCGGPPDAPQEADAQPAPIPLPRRSPMRTRYSGEKNIGTTRSSSTGQRDNSAASGSHTMSPRRSFLESVSSRTSGAPGLFENIEVVRVSGGQGAASVESAGGQGVDFMWREGPPAAASELAPPLADVGKVSSPPRNARTSRRRPSEDHFA